MSKELESIVMLLQNINSQLSKPVFDDKILKEGKECALHAKQNSRDINLLLNELLDTDVKDANKMVKKLIFLHLKLSDSIGHIEQIHEMVKDLVAQYREHL